MMPGINLIKAIHLILVPIFAVTFCTGIVHATNLNKNQSLNNASLKDSFDNNSITGFRHFTYFDDCLNIEKKHITLALQEKKRCIINILPMFGKNAEFKFSLRWNKEVSSRFHVYYDYRYTLHDDYGLIVFSSKKRKIYYRDKNRKWQSIRMNFKQNKWTSFSLVRKKSNITLYSNGKKLFSTSIKDKKRSTNINEHNEYGGFAIGLDKREFFQRIDIDNISIEGNKAQRDLDILQKEFILNNIPYTFLIIYEHDYEDWANQQLNISIPYLERLADLYGVPPVQQFMGIVQARGKYYYAGHGVNAKTGIISRWPKENRYGHLDTHELAHNWGYLYQKEWLEEGAANLPRVLFGERDSKDLMRINYRLSRQQRNDFKNWIKEIYIDDNKFGWEGDMPTDRTDKFYWKASVLHRIIYRILGEEDYRRVHERIYERGGNINTEDFLAIFKDVTGQSADHLLQGWVYPGRGKFNPEDVVKDDDNDGLNNLEETLYGTNPLHNDTDNDQFSDFEEMRSGFNPLDDKKPGSQYLITDGIIKDWEKIPLTFTDAEGDAQNDSETTPDFKFVKVYADKLNNNVHLLIKFHNTVEFNDNTPYWLQVQLDLDNDGKLDNRVVYWLPSKKIRIISKFGMSGTRDETGTANRYLSSEGANVYYGNILNNGFIEATLPLNHFATRADRFITIKIKGGFDKAVDSFDKSTLHLKLQDIYNKAIPSKVFIPEAVY